MLKIHPELNKYLRTTNLASWTLLISFWAFTVHAVVPMLPVGKTLQITDHVYVIPDERVRLVPNVGIIVGDNGVLVVDTGMGPANAEIVLGEVRKITNKPIRYLVSTHFHPEHIFGAQAFPEETVIIYASSQYDDLKLKGRKYLDWFIEMFGDDVRDLLKPVNIIPPDITFERKAKIDLGNMPIELLHYGKPAHTTGDTLVYLPKAKVLFIGGLAPNRFFPIMPDPDSSGNGWIKSLDEIEQLDVDFVVPGHGEIGDRQLIRNVKNYLIDIRSRVLQLKAENKSIEQIQKILLPEFAAKYPDWEDSYWINNTVENFYLESKNP